MSLTAAQVGSIAFGEPAEGEHGYHDGEVDTFLARVADEMRRLEAENQALTGQLTDRLHRLETDRDQVLEHVEVLRAELMKARVDAPPSEAPRLLELAEQTAAEHMAEARRVAGDLHYRASVEAARLTSGAELLASTIVADARHAHAERVSGLVTKRSEALARIDALCEEARERRAALIALLEHRLRSMDPKPSPR